MISNIRDHYVLRINGEPAERPQHVFMRTALAIHRGNMQLVLETYEYLSSDTIMHSHQTLHYAGTKDGTMNSSTIINLPSNSTEDTYDTMKECATALQGYSDVGISLQSVPSAG